MTKKQLLKEINKELSDYSVDELKLLLGALMKPEEEVVTEEEIELFLKDLQNEGLLN
jgi:hypothetical protein